MMMVGMDKIFEDLILRVIPELCLALPHDVQLRQFADPKQLPVRESPSFLNLSCQVIIGVDAISNDGITYRAVQ